MPALQLASLAISGRHSPIVGYWFIEMSTIRFVYTHIQEVGTKTKSRLYTSSTLDELADDTVEMLRVHLDEVKFQLGWLSAAVSSSESTGT